MVSHGKRGEEVFNVLLPRGSFPFSSTQSSEATQPCPDVHFGLSLNSLSSQTL